MSTIADIEDTLIGVMRDLNLFRMVDSLGRKGMPVTRNYPAAFVYFVRERSDTSVPRPVMEKTFEVLIQQKNLQSESQAASDAYSILESVRDAVNGKQLGHTDIGTFTCVSTELTDYADGVISYVLQFVIHHYLPVQYE